MGIFWESSVAEFERDTAVGETREKHSASLRILYLSVPIILPLTFCLIILIYPSCDTIIIIILWILQLFLSDLLLHKVECLYTVAYHCTRQ